MLSITGLSKTYDNGVHALQGVDLSIGKGMFGLLGPNGAGKSSLMRTISTLQSADSGSITFDSIDVFKDPQALRQRLGYLPQDFGVYPRVSAYDLLDHMAVLKGIHNKAERVKSRLKDYLRTLIYINIAQKRSVAFRAVCASVLVLHKPY